MSICRPSEATLDFLKAQSWPCDPDFKMSMPRKKIKKVYVHLAYSYLPCNSIEDPCSSYFGILFFKVCIDGHGAKRIVLPFNEVNQLFKS